MKNADAVNQADSRNPAAVEEARKQIDSGLIQGIVFADTRNRKIESLGKQCIHPSEK